MAREVPDPEATESEDDPGEQPAKRARTEAGDDAAAAPTRKPRAAPSKADQATKKGFELVRCTAWA